MELGYVGIGSLYVDVSMLKTFKVDKKFHGFIVWIEKSVMRVTDRGLPQGKTVLKQESISNHV